MLRYFYILVACLFLTACATKPIETVVEPIDRPQLQLPLPSAVQLDDMTWIVITDENAEEIINTLIQKKQKVVLFALTPEGYQALALNNKKMQVYLKQLHDQLAAYKEYYERVEK